MNPIYPLSPYNNPPPPSGPVVPLAQLAMQAAQRGNPVGAAAASDGAGKTDPDPLLAPFLQELGQWPPLDASSSPAEISAWAAQLDQLLSQLETTDPLTLDRKIALLQQALAQQADNAGLKQALTSLMMWSINLQTEMIKWMADIINSGGESKEFTDW